MSAERKGKQQKEVRDKLAVIKKLQELVQAKRPIEILLEETADRGSTLKLLTGRKQSPLDIAAVHYTIGENEPQIEAAEAGRQPTLLVYERRVIDEFSRFTQVGKYLPGFLDEIVPGSAKRPVWLFRSILEYRLRLPLVRIRFVGNQVVANFSSTSQPQF